jgi:hypothetical protein
MTRPEPIEVIVLRTNATESKKNGLIRTVTLMVPNDGDHPFAGLIGERLHIVALNAEAIQTPPPDRSSQRAEDGGSEGAGSVLPVRDPAPAKREWSLANRIAMRCHEGSFQRFLQEFYATKNHWHAVWRDTPNGSAVSDVAAHVVRWFCGVKSRAEIEDTQLARDRWNTLEAEYEQFQRAAA